MRCIGVQRKIQNRGTLQASNRMSNVECNRRCASRSNLEIVGRQLVGSVSRARHSQADRSFRSVGNCSSASCCGCCTDAQASPPLSPPFANPRHTVPVLRWISDSTVQLPSSSVPVEKCNSERPQENNIRSVDSCRFDDRVGRTTTQQQAWHDGNAELLTVVEESLSMKLYLYRCVFS